jgi:hypothetical protein
MPQYGPTRIWQIQEEPAALGLQLELMYIDYIQLWSGETPWASRHPSELLNISLSSWEKVCAQGHHQCSYAIVWAHVPKLVGNGFRSSKSSWALQQELELIKNGKPHELLGKTLSFWTSNLALGQELEHLVTQSWTTTWAPGHKHDRSRNSMSSWETAWANSHLSGLLVVKLIWTKWSFRKEVITHQGPEDGCIFLD